MWAVIGGTGFEKFENFKNLNELDRKTPFGETSIGFKKVNLDGEEALFIPRHGTNHSLLPTEVNYRANIYALKKMGATKLLGFSAVGSLTDECAPGDLVIPGQFIDRTKGIRKSSFFGEGLVGHVSLAEPATLELVEELGKKSKDFSFKSHFNKTLIVMEGPQFSTKAESYFYRGLKAHIIGMTSYPEYALAREAGLAYMNCCFVTDYDCWKEDIPHVTVHEVMKVMKENNEKAFHVARALLHSQDKALQSLNEKERGFGSALMTPIESLNEKQKQWVEVLIK